METMIDSSLEQKITQLEQDIVSMKNQIEANKRDNSVCIICFSGNWDKLFAALSMASGSLALGLEVHIFFSFWSLNALRSNQKYLKKNKSLIQQMFGKIIPSGFNKAPLSKYNFWGFGKICLKKIMKKKGIDDIDLLFADIEELGAKIYVCDTSAEMFGVDCSELSPQQINQCGSTTFLAKSINSKITLFI